MSHVAHMNASCHVYEWAANERDILNLGTHIDESCRTYGCVMSHTWMSHVTHVNGQLPANEWAVLDLGCGTGLRYICVFICIYIFTCTYVHLHTYTSTYIHTYMCKYVYMFHNMQQIRSHTSLSRVTTYECLIPHVCRSSSTGLRYRISHTYEWV